MTSKVKNKTKFQLDNLDDKSPDRCIVIVPVLQTRAEPNAEAPFHTRSESARLEEALGLARAIDLDIVHSGLVVTKKPRPATLIGAGKVEEIKGIVAALDAGLVIVDQALTPVQQRNLEKAWNAKVLDRTGLILEIFGARAQTKEGKLQVDLAHLTYQKGRLVRSWTHLERQRGALGFVGGPGETQIEADRRQLQNRIIRLKKDLEKVRRTRHLHRSKRKKVPHPIVALVGYTNAGKSTLFNFITGSKVYAKDKLFATLDPVLRRLDLPEGTKVILSDTVGFVSDLPTHLVAAFRATLEEVVEADLVLHVRDISHDDSAAQAADVDLILSQLGIDPGDSNHIVEVWNKVDLLTEERLGALQTTKSGDAPLLKAANPFLVSAESGYGVDELLLEIEKRISGSHAIVNLQLGLGAMNKIGWLYENTQVMKRVDHDDGTMNFKVRVAPALRDEVMALVSA